MRRIHAVVALLVTALALTACQSAAPEDEADSPDVPATTAPSPSDTSPSPVQSPSPSPTPVDPGPVRPGRVTEIAGGLAAPWGLAFLPNGSALVSERDSGRVLRITPEGQVTQVGTVSGLLTDSEAGLLGLAVGPRFGQDRLVYAYMSTPSGNRVVRMPLRDGSLGAAEVILDEIPAASFHDGGRLRFGPDGMLYVATGDAGARESAQSPDSLAGKILRIRPNGTIPADNPARGSAVYSSGHRNVQGLAFDANGRLWASEFGENRLDELNLIRPGRNYGWPVFEGPSDGGDGPFVDPVRTWPTSEASPSGLAYVRGTLFMAALRGERLWQIPINLKGPARTSRPTAYLEDRFGRLRTVEAAPNGTLWVLTNNTDGRGTPHPDDDRLLQIQLTASPL